MDKIELELYPYEIEILLEALKEKFSQDEYLIQTGELYASSNYLLTKQNRIKYLNESLSNR